MSKPKQTASDGSLKPTLQFDKILPKKPDATA